MKNILQRRRVACASRSTWERAANGCRGTVAEQIGRFGEQRADSREQTAESRSDRMVNRGEPLRRSQIAVQAGKQAGSQPA